MIDGEPGPEPNRVQSLFEPIHTANRSRVTRTHHSRLFGRASGSSHSQTPPGGVQTESELWLHLGPIGRGELGQN
eukprot:scaffold129926_cov48-Phaeocystis_antarctica.AAC.2